MAKVGIVMGSDSDMPIMAQAAEVLEQFGIDFEMTIISAHRAGYIFRVREERREQRHEGHYRRRRQGSSPSGYVRSDLPASGHRNPDEDF